MTSMKCLLLLVTMLSCSSAFNWQKVQNLNQGKMGYYSYNCAVDWDLATSLGGSFAQEPAECMNDCIVSGGDAFDVSVSGCNCFKRDMAKAPKPFYDIPSFSSFSTWDMAACGCIESATGK